AYVENNPVNLTDPLGLLPCARGGDPWCPPTPEPPKPGPFVPSTCAKPDDPWCPKPPNPNPTHCDISPDDPFCKDCKSHPDFSGCNPLPEPPAPPKPPKMPRPKPPKQPPKKPNKPSKPAACPWDKKRR